MTRFLSRASLAVASVAIVVLAAQIADAQDVGGGGRGGGQRRGGGFGGRGGASLVSLAGNAEVQTLLKITDAQKTKITAINEKLTADRQELRGGGGGGPETIAEMQKLAADADAKVAEALDEAQNTNILSVLIQASGGAAATNAQLQKRLKITDAQKTQLQEVAQAARGGGGRGMRGATPEEQAAARAEASKPYIDVLTADQKTAWGTLEKAQTVGDELLTQLRRGGGGGRGRRGGGGGGGGGGAAGGAGGAAGGGF